MQVVISWTCSGVWLAENAPKIDRAEKGKSGMSIGALGLRGLAVQSQTPSGLPSTLTSKDMCEGVEGSETSSA